MRASYQEQVFEPLPKLFTIFFSFYILVWSERLNPSYGCLSPADVYGDRIHASMIKVLFCFEHFGSSVILSPFLFFHPIICIALQRNF